LANFVLVPRVTGVNADELGIAKRRAGDHFREHRQHLIVTARKN